MSNGPKPIIGIPTSQQDITGRGQTSHTTGMRYVQSIADHCDATPMILPSMEKPTPPQEIVACIDGLFLTGGRANVEPHHYGGPPFPDDEPIDPVRDKAVLPLVRACVDAVAYQPD